MAALLERLNVSSPFCKRMSTMLCYHLPALDYRIRTDAACFARVSTISLSRKTIPPHTASPTVAHLPYLLTCFTELALSSPLQLIERETPQTCKVIEAIWNSLRNTQGSTIKFLHYCDSGNRYSRRDSVQSIPTVASGTRLQIRTPVQIHATIIIWNLSLARTTNQIERDLSRSRRTRPCLPNRPTPGLG